MFKGVTRGLQLIADFFALLIKAAEKSNAEAVVDCLGVARQWRMDTVNSAGAVKINPITLLGNADPWADSRRLYQTVALKWEGRL